jgi:hypothetical protein
MARENVRIAIAATLSALLAATPGRAQTVAGPSGAGVDYVPGSTQEVCQLTGAVSKTTAQQFGLISADRGYSFIHEGKLWFLFGDAQPTKFFPQRGPHDAATDNTHNRWGPGSSTENLDNDAIAFAPPGPAGVCPTLQFIAQTRPAAGAYTSPSLAYNGTPVPLQTNESPIAGFDYNGRAYVIFGTNNPEDTNTPQTCGETRDLFCLGSPLSTIVGRLDDRSSLSFTGLYTLSGPPLGQTASAGRFVEVALAAGADGYLYFFGTTGGRQQAGPRPCGAADECYRHSYVRLARMLPRDIENTSNGRPAAIEYWVKTGAGAGAGAWKNADESASSPLFEDAPPCMGELGVEYNAYLHRWVMLYNCLSANPRGIVMRTASYPWGPWSAPQTIFNPIRDKGLCYFIHSHGGENCPPDAPNPPSENPAAATGGDYGPYFIAGWTTGSTGAGSVQTSTIYYTVSSFVPYGQVILKSTITAR